MRTFFMEVIQLQLNSQTLSLARQVAFYHQTTLETLIQGWVEKLARQPLVAEDPWWGLFAQDRDLLDQIVAEAMRDRECQPLRQITDGNG
jgi:hypothetical protein